MKNYHTINLIAIVLLIIGGLNWGLIGLFDFDLIGVVFHEVLSRIIFVLVGLAALWRIALWLKQKSK
ncbi:MAG: DUF378 domain-containing protein [Proteobacteria bacterium]|nr:DUF378 domain-containing protein [Pseudomonadota bacterium]